ncbi:hypothetical protein ACQP1P_15290 [Dactylosporangium sp. CA-052675]|uniref:hypothetical protein n=1 Tax=Dactylosporangium sp. CA-052675 TaxID=3239927 RepID=UPI003D8AD9D6
MVGTGTAQYDTLLREVNNLRPSYRRPLDSPYHISNELYEVLRHVLHDVGGEPDVPMQYEEVEEAERPWEMATYVTCECLGWRGVWNSEMRRRMENDLGATQYFGLPYYARWATVAARILVDKGIITTDELGAKIDEIRARRQEERS